MVSSLVNLAEATVCLVSFFEPMRNRLMVPRVVRPIVHRGKYVFPLFFSRWGAMNDLDVLLLLADDLAIDLEERTRRLVQRNEAVTGADFDPETDDPLNPEAKAVARVQSIVDDYLRPAVHELREIREHMYPS